MGKKLLSILLAVAMMVSMIPAGYAEDEITVVEEPLEAEDVVIVDEPAEEPAPAPAEEPEKTIPDPGAEINEVIASGECGDDLTWELDDQGTLTISGTGDMWDYGWEGTPWYGYRDNIDTVIINDGATNISCGAFYNCTNLTNITIPDSVKSLESSVFCCCSSLISVTIPSGVTVIPHQGFLGCESLQDVTIPYGVTKIDGSAFAGCDSLTDIDLPETLTRIEGSAFNGCISLTSVTIPEGVTRLGLYSFSGCRNLTNVVIPSSLTDISWPSFDYCTSLTEFTVAENNPSFKCEDGVLFSKNGSVLLCCPAGRTGDYVVPDTVTSFADDAFSGCVYLTDVTMPEDMTSISNRAFSECTGLTSITIPNSVTSIGYYAFAYCTGLTSITIPASVTSIDYYAFSQCENLHAIFFEGSAPEFGEGCFYDVTAAVYYPEDDPTWTEDVMQNYGGTITWRASGSGPAVTPLTLDVEATAEITEVGGSAYFSFVPEETDEYYFASYSDSDTMCYLYDADWNELQFNDDGADGGNFLIRYTLNAGETYYFGARYYGSDETGSFPVKLSFGYGDYLRVVTPYQNDAFALRGESYTMHVTVRASDMDAVHYQWAYFEYNDGYIDLEGETGSSLTVTVSHGRAHYSCNIYSDSGESYYVYYSLWENGSGAAEDLSLDTSETFFLNEKDVKWFRFIPAEDGKYSITYSGWSCGELYDAELNYLSGAQSGVEAFLTAGNTYYYTVYFVDTAATGDITVQLSKFQVSPLELDTEATATIAEPGDCAYFSFTPEETDEYVFLSLADKDTYGYIYDSDWNQIASNDDSGFGNNFLVRYTLTAGNTYYFGARYYSSENTGSFPVMLRVYIDNELNVSRVGEETVFVAPGEPAELQVAVSAKNMDLVHIKWSIAEYGYGYQAIDGETGTSLSIAEPYDHAQYSCEVSDDYGSGDTIYYDLWVDGRGGAAELSANSTAQLSFSGPREVQWFRFTPEETGVYRFTHEGYTKAYLFREDMSLWDYAEGWIEQTLNEGSTYYFALAFVDENSWEDVSVTLQERIEVTDFESLKRAVALGYEKEISIPYGSVVEVNEDFTIPEDIKVSWGESSFTVLEGVSLTVEGRLEGGNLTVNGTLINENDINVWVLLGEGTIKNNGTIWFERYGFTCTLVPGEGSSLGTYCEDEEFVTYCKTPLNCTLILEPYYSSTINLSEDLTIPSHVILYNCETLNIQEGCTLTNNGRISGRDFYLYGGTLINNGSIKYNEGIYLRDGGEIDNRGLIQTSNISIEEAIALMGDGQMEYGLNDYYSTFDTDLTIPEGMTVSGEFHYAGFTVYLTIPEGVTVVNNGELRVYTLYNYGSFINNGTLRAKNIHDYSGGLVNNGHLGVFEVSAVDDEIRVSPNETATLEVEVTSDDPDKVSFQWYRVDDNGDYILLEGATGSSYVTEPITGPAKYFCIVDSGYGYREQVWFYVYVESHFSADFVEQYLSVAPYETATLAVVATSDDPDRITYKWEVWHEVVHGEGENTWTNWEWEVIEGANGSSYTTEPITRSTEYYCYVTDGYGNSWDGNFYVNLENHFEAYAEEANISVEPYEEAVLQVVAGSDYPELITYQWYEYREVVYDDDPDMGTWTNWEWAPIEGETGSSYTTKPIDEYVQYYCVVKDGFDGNSTVWFYVSVDSDFGAWAEESSVYADYDTPATLKVIAESNYPEQITYQWYHYVEVTYGEDENAWTNWEWTPIEGETGSTLITEPVTWTTEYYCHVEDGFGSRTDVWFTAYVQNHFYVDAEQTSFYVAPNDTATLEVIAESDHPEQITYRWYHYTEVEHQDEWDTWTSWEWVLLEGETGSTLTTEPITRYSRYYCVVEDGYGGNSTIWFYVYIQNHFSAEVEQDSFRIGMGETAEMEVIATSDNPEQITYRWYRGYKRYYNEGQNWYWDWDEDGLIEGANGPALTSDPMTGESQHYVCCVEDGYGSYNNFGFYIYYENHFQVRVDQNNFYVSPGETATLTVYASSDHPELITYQWYSADEYGNWAAIDGATDSSYTTEPITEYSRYVCRVEDGYDSYQARWFYVNIDTHFSVDWEQNEFRLGMGETAEMEVIATSDYPELITYQWYRGYKRYYNEGQNWYWDWDEDGLIEGANGPALTSDPMTGESQHYVCWVRDGFGSEQNIGFYIYYENHFEAYAEQESLYVSPVETFTLNVIASSDDPELLSYQWHDRYGNEISGETGPTLTAGPISEYSEYFCRVEDGFGSYRNVWFYVHIQTNLSVEWGQNEFWLGMGETVEMEVLASSDYPDAITYQWYKGYRYFYPDGSWTWSWNEDGLIEGANGPTLTSDPIDEEPLYYVCRISDGFGSSTTRSFRVYLDNHFSAYAEEKNVYVTPGETVTLNVIATSDNPELITYQWYVRDKYYYEDGSWDWAEFILDGETGSSYTTGPVTEYKEYFCRAENGYGTVWGVWFYVHPDNHFSAYAEQESILANYGESVTAEVIATSSDPDKITYQWYKGDLGFEERDGYSFWGFADDGLLAGEESSTLTIDSVTEAHPYICVVRDGYGNEELVWIYVAVDVHFEARQAEQDVYVSVGHSATLEVIAASDEPEKLTYQWYEYREFEYVDAGETYTEWRWIPIDGETGSSFVTDPITAYTTYLCWVSAGYGEMEILKFYVHPDNHFSATSVQEVFNVASGDSVTLEVNASADNPDAITYQWYQMEKRANSEGDSAWSWPDEPIAGAEDSTLTVGPVTEAMHFICLVRDGYGNEIGVNFFIYLDTHFEAYAVQSDFFISPDETVTLEVIATSDDPDAITYRWYSADSDENWAEIESEHGSSYTMLSLVRSALIHCEVSDGYGKSYGFDFNIRVDYSSMITALAQPIELDVETTAVIDPYDFAFYYYIPEEDGEYILTSYSDLDTYVHLYNAELVQIETDDDSGNGSNFRLAYHLTAGETYYYGVRYYTRYRSGSFPIILTRGNDLQATAEQSELHVSLNERATLSVIATATDASMITYQWYRITPVEHQDEEGTWTDLVPTLIEGETGSSLTTDPITEFVQYYCRVEDGYGSWAEVWFNVFIETHLEVYAVQNNFTVSPNESATLVVVATSDCPERITYQWYVWAEVEYSNEMETWTEWTWVPLEGETGSSFVTGPVTQYTEYLCRVDDGFGSYQSEWFSVSVSTNFNAYPEQQSVSVPLGEQATLRVIASSAFPEAITYQWYRAIKVYYSETSWGWNYDDSCLLEGETSSSLTTPPVEEYQVYVCRVEDGYGSYQTVWFYVSVETHFTATANPNRFYVVPETELTLQVVASSDLPEQIVYQWYEYDQYYGSRILLEGETSSSFTTPPIETYKIYLCMVEDGFGKTVSLYFYITPETHLTAYAVQEQITVLPEGSAVLEVVASSDYPDKISYEWHKSSGEIIEGETGASMTVGPVTEEAYYYCMVYDGYGNSLQVVFHVTVQTHFTARAVQSELYVAPGSTPTLEIIASSDYPEKLSYSWYRATRYTYSPLDWDWGFDSPIEGENGPTLTVEPVTEWQHYYCLVSDGYNNPVRIIIDVYVDSEFRVVSPEAGITYDFYVPYGQTKTFSVEVSSKYPDAVSYEWFSSPLGGYLDYYYYANLQTIDGADGSTLTTEEITQPTGYICKVSDGYGVSCYIYYRVFIQTHLTAVAEQERFTVSPGEDVTLRVIANCDEPEKLSYEWYSFAPYYDYYSQYVEEYYPIDGVRDSSYTVNDVDAYRKIACRVTDGYGNAVVVYFYVAIQNHLTAEAVNPVNYIGENDTVELKVNVSGDDLTGLRYYWFSYSYFTSGQNVYYGYYRIEGANGSSCVVNTMYEKYRCIVVDRYGTPISVDFEVHIQESGEGYKIKVSDFTKGAATCSIGTAATYSGTVNFTVSTSDDMAVLVAVKDGDSYTRLTCTTSGKTHSFTVEVGKDTEICLVLKGDVNLDGILRASDGTMLKRSILKTYTLKNDLAFMAADLNGDGILRASEGTQIARYLLGTFTIKW